ncbi:hypothetical protein [Marinobacter sp. CP1]|uniref:hypothetical protein n=1 Tax=Marinobacter sp. CP1 TaxID=1671721 RepID=UPI0011873D2C|nr:hypothetical protein [Marinobacter sp. CP1]
MGVSARAAGEHQEQQRSVGGDEVWQLAAAGSPGGVAGGWVQGRRPAGAAVGRLPGGVIRQRQQAASRCPGLGVCRVGVSARMAGHHQEQGRSVGGVWFGSWRQPEAPEPGLARRHGWR